MFCTLYGVFRRLIRKPRDTSAIDRGWIYRIFQVASSPHAFFTAWLSTVIQPKLFSCSAVLTDSVPLDKVLVQITILSGWVVPCTKKEMINILICPPQPRYQARNMGLTPRGGVLSFSGSAGHG